MSRYFFPGCRLKLTDGQEKVAIQSRILYIIDDLRTRLSSDVESTSI
jgi:hypothetical protein